MTGALFALDEPSRGTILNLLIVVLAVHPATGQGRPVTCSGGTVRGRRPRYRGKQRRDENQAGDKGARKADQQQSPHARRPGMA